MSKVVREWTLTEEIGRGGMGVVYRATHEMLPGDWAIKLIHPELGRDAESRARFLSEVRILKRLHHPNIIQVETPFVESGEIYLPMEFLTGHSLDSDLKGEYALWPSARTIDIVLQAAEGLGYAHRQEPAVIHRDIKPGNIHLLDNGQVKLLDFGLARTLGDQSITAVGKAVGTPAYMAPEVLAGQKATPYSDVYSLGIVLFQLLTGRLPYEMPEKESSIQAVFVAVIRGIERGLPDVREFVSTVPSNLADLTMQALSRDPQNRPSDGAEFASLLRKLSVQLKLMDSAERSGGYEADRTAMAIDLESVTRSARRVEPMSSEKNFSINANPPMLDMVPKSLRKVHDVKSTRIAAEHPTRLQMYGNHKWMTGFLILFLGVSSGIWWLGYEVPRRDTARVEAERLEVARVEAERLEAARVEAERLEAARVEAERLEAERLEAERLEAERRTSLRKIREEAARKKIKRICNSTILERAADEAIRREYAKFVKEGKCQ